MSDYPPVGQPAPPLAVDTWVQGGPPAPARHLLLEFWSTTCGPCVAAIGHLNQLAGRFADAIDFVSLTAEDAERIERFIAGRPITGGVATDERDRTRKAYGIYSIPHSFLIDDRGVLRWHGHPNALSESMLAAYLDRGETPEVATTPARENQTESAEDAAALFTLSARPVANPDERSGMFNVGADTFSARLRNVPFQGALHALLDLPAGRIEWVGAAPDIPLDIDIRAQAPVTTASARAQAAATLCGIFGGAISRETAEREVWILSGDGHRLKDMSEYGGAASTSSSKDEISIVNHSLADAARRLGDVLGAPILDETGLQGLYDITVPNGDIERVARTLADDYGLRLAKAVRALDLTVATFP